MLCAYTRPRSQVSVFQDHWSSGLYVHDFGPRARNDLDLQYSHSFINKMSASTNFQVTGCNSFRKIHCFHFFLWKSPYYKIWPCRKIGQGHSRVIIWTNYDKQESPILHTNFRENQPAGSGEEDFWRVFTIHMGMAAILVMWPAS